MANNFGQETESDRWHKRMEAAKLILIIQDSDKSKLTESEKGFVEQMKAILHTPWAPLGKQLFKLRDIKDKVL